MLFFYSTNTVMKLCRDDVGTTEWLKLNTFPVQASSQINSHNDITCGTLERFKNYPQPVNSLITNFRHIGMFLNDGINRMC